MGIKELTYLNIFCINSCYINGPVVPVLPDCLISKELAPYTYEQFYQISVHLLTKEHKISHDIAKNISDKVWTDSRNIRDCLRVGRMAKSVDDIQFLL